MNARHVMSVVAVTSAALLLACTGQAEVRASGSSRTLLAGFFRLPRAGAQGLPRAPVPSPDSFSPDAQGVYKVGGDVRPPRVIYTVAPEYSQAARRKKVSGNVRVGLIVDEKGVPRDVRVAQGLGLGLDEKAVEAVRQYKFKPAMKGDTPVPVHIFADVNFQIF